MFIQLSVHPVMQLVLIQSSDSFLFFAFFLFLDFLSLWSSFWQGVVGWGGSWTKTWGLRRFSSWIQQAEYDLCPKVNLSQEWNNFSINKHKNLVCWLTGNKKKKVKMEYDEFQHNGAPRPLGLSFYFALVFVCFSLETRSFSWDLEWAHPCAVLVLPYSFQVL